MNITEESLMWELKDIIDNLCKKYNITNDDIIVRTDGRIEWRCEHGVGHPIHVPKHYQDWGWVHGCDGCCSNLKIERNEN